MPLANIHHFLIVPLILSFNSYCLTLLFYTNPCPIMSYLCVRYLFMSTFLGTQ